MSFLSSDNLFTYTLTLRKEFFFLFLVIVTIIFLYPFSNYKLATTDDFICYMMSKLEFGKLLEAHDAAAKNQGRIHFYISFILHEVAYFVKDYHLMSLIRNLFKASNCLLFAYIVYMHSENIYAFFLAYLLPFIFFQDGSNYNAISGYTFFYQLHFNFYLALYICIFLLAKKFDTLTYILMTVSCLIFLTMSEAAIPMLIPVFIYLAFFFYKSRINKRLAVLYAAPLVILPALVGGLWIFFNKFLARSVYSGVVPSFSPLKFLQTLLHFSLGHFPGTAFVRDNYFIANGFGTYLRSLEGFPQGKFSLNPLFDPFYLGVSLLVTMFIYLCVSKVAVEMSLRRALLILSMGISTVLAPNILIGLSARYQELQYQLYATTYSYFSIYGMVIVLILMLFCIKSISNPTTKMMLSAFVYLFILLSSTTSLATNYSFGTLRYMDNIKWHLAELFVKSKDFADIKPGDTINTINLYGHTLTKRSQSQPKNNLWSTFFSVASSKENLTVKVIDHTVADNQIPLFFDLFQDDFDASETAFYVFARGVHCKYKSAAEVYPYANTTIIGLHTNLKSVIITYWTADANRKTIVKRLPFNTKFSIFSITDDERILLNSIAIKPVR